MKKYDAFIIDASLDSRMRLKSATASTPSFGKVHLLGALADAQNRLAGGERTDVVFISHSFGEEDSKAFINQCKGTQGGQDTAYILILKPDMQGNSNVAKNVLNGADGFLFEPYSVDSLIEITNMLETLKTERSNTRKIAALEMLVKDTISNLDKVAYNKAIGRDPGLDFKKLKESAAALKDLDETSKQDYLGVAFQKFENAPIPPKIVARVNYQGVSARAKKRMEAKKAKAETSASGATEAPQPSATPATENK